MFLVVIAKWRIRPFTEVNTFGGKGDRERWASDKLSLGMLNLRPLHSSRNVLYAIGYMHHNLRRGLD